MSAVATPPRLPLDLAAALADDLFGLQAIAAPLPSERDQNIRLTTADGRRFVLKIANAAEDVTLLDAENEAMARLTALNLCPSVVESVNRRLIEQVECGGTRHAVRLITWLEGAPMGAVKRHSDALLQDLGRALGQMDAALAGFDHPALHRTFHWDVAQAGEVISNGLGGVKDASLREAIAVLFERYQRDAVSLLPALRRQVIHNDANDYNVIVGGGTDLYTRNQHVIGLVDFGDMVFSQRVNDPAIAMAYAALGKDDPLAAAAQVARGYHAVNPLDEAEIAVLFHLMAMRLCMSACHAARQQAARPGDPYLSISQAPIRAALPQLAAIHPRFAHYVLRDACGLEPVPHTPHVVNWLKAHQSEFASVVDVDLKTALVVAFDLSVGSPLLSGDPRQNAAGPLTERLFAHLPSPSFDKLRMPGGEKRVGVNGYDEARIFYTSSAFAGKTPLDEARTVHLGVDLTLPPGSPVHAPIAGAVHGFEDARATLDYGPVIVLRHDADGIPFYTLYGHLSRASLAGLRVGQPIAAGQRIGWVGAPPENGDWWPHVHVQLITDLLDIPCNFNGSALPSQRAVWKSLSPDPNLILQIPALGHPHRDVETRILSLSKDASLQAQRRAYIGPNLSLSYRQPLHIVRGWMQYLYDADGRRFLDAYNNVPHVGHSHPRVVKAVQDQLAVLNTNTRYLQGQLTEYAERLTALLPAPLQVCYFTASGSEANELALRLARAATGQRDLIVMDSAYHGHTTTLIDISPYKHNGPGGQGAPDWVHTTLTPDAYRGPFKASDPEAGHKYAQDVERIIHRLRSNRRGLCGYIAETCPSVGGQIMLPEGYLAEAYRHVRAAGGLCIADEVQTGFGRIGTHFWAFEAHGVIPDIVVLGKPIANGTPMGAVITTPEIAGAFDNGMEFFSTFGGSTAACAAALATLEVTLDENLQAHALDVGAHLLARMRGLQARYPIIGDVRGSGLFIGVELVRDRETLEPAAEEASFVANRMRELGVLLGTDGPHHNVIKIRGPMPFDRANADSLIDVFARVLEEDFT
jgi:4-aminobutyrate aminotransferase-like enzyme/Ser/Thr protein kinase RdoA (MazF antagonist)